MAIRQALQPLRFYGQQIYVDEAEDAIVDLAEQFCMKVRGKQIPYQYTGRRLE